MGYLGTKPANSPLTSELIPDGIITTSDLASGLTVNFADGSASTPSITNDGDTNTGIFFPTADTIAFAEGGSESMRIDSSGNLLVGTTAQQTGANGKISVAGAVDGVAGTFTNNSNGSAYTLQVFNYTTATGGGTGRFITFRSGSTPTQVGQIVGDGTNTTYSTSSDYRLKENVQPMTGALAKVALLKPCTYTWKLNGSSGEGFIANELQEVCPQAVIGEKDAVDENGNIDPQGIDTSFLVATLTAAIQEQQIIITELKARIEALESK
jgi:hypothetical protein